eukprot:1031727-Rhodomonas_salina.1
MQERERGARKQERRRTPKVRGGGERGSKRGGQDSRTREEEGSKEGKKRGEKEERRGKEERGEVAVEPRVPQPAAVALHPNLPHGSGVRDETACWLRGAARDANVELPDVREPQRRNHAQASSNLCSLSLEFTHLNVSVSRLLGDRLHFEHRAVRVRTDHLNTSSAESSAHFAQSGKDSWNSRIRCCVGEDGGVLKP